MNSINLNTIYYKRPKQTNRIHQSIGEFNKSLAAAKSESQQIIQSAPSSASSSSSPTSYVNQSCSKSIIQFYSETSLHGFKHIVDKNEGSKFIQIFINQCLWTIVCIFSCAFSIILIALIWDRYSSAPTITTVETTNYPIWNVAFPAVTICNVNKVYGPAVRNLSRILNQQGFDTENLTLFMTKLAQTIEPQLNTNEMNDATFLKIYNELEQNNYTIDRLMFELMQPCDQLLKSCLWLGQPISCMSIFRVVKSSIGYCCSFNYYAVKKMKDDQLHDKKIFYVSGAGPYVGLDILLDVESNEYFSYTKPIYGVQILLHDYDNYPQTSLTTVTGQPGNDLTIAVIPSILFSSPDVRLLTIGQRDCFFEDEIDLNTAYVYNYQSCITDCIVDYITEACDCLPFYYWEEHLNELHKKYRQCSLHDITCLYDHRVDYLSLRPTMNPSIQNQTIYGMNCYCLPGCTEEFYNAQTIYAKHSSDNLSSSQFVEHRNLSKYLTVAVHFKDNTCIVYRRDAIMTWDVLYASIGGIISLFLGSSIISLIEIGYFIWCRCLSVFILLSKLKKNKCVNNNVSQSQLFFD